MDKPVETIERMSRLIMSGTWSADVVEIVKYAASIPDGAVPVVWPAELTRERLMELHNWCGDTEAKEALRALAAIAPVRKKRVVNLWRNGMGQLQEWPVEWEPSPPVYIPEKWRCVARNVELED